MNNTTNRSGWGYCSLGLAGYEVKINDDNESVTWLYIGTEREQRTHTARIYYTVKDRAFFRAGQRRIYLDECLRIGI